MLKKDEKHAKFIKDLNKMPIRSLVHQRQMLQISDADVDTKARLIGLIDERIAYLKQEAMCEQE